MRFSRVWLYSKLILAIIALPIAVRGATVGGLVGEVPYFSEVDTLDVPILKEDGQRVTTDAQFGYGTLAQRTATSPSRANFYWWLTDSVPPRWSHYNGASWDELRGDVSRPATVQTMAQGDAILGCGTDRAMVRVVAARRQTARLRRRHVFQWPTGCQLRYHWGPA